MQGTGFHIPYNLFYGLNRGLARPWHPGSASACAVGKEAQKDWHPFREQPVLVGQLNVRLVSAQ